MRDLTEEEIREYFEFAYHDVAASDFNREQVHLIGEIAKERGLMEALQKKLAQGLLAGMHPNDLFLSSWVSAFQMGRECESRLLTLALKGKPVKHGNV